MKGIDEVTSAESPILKEGSDPPDCEDAFNAAFPFSNEQESLDYDNKNQKGIANEDDKGMKGIDNIISAESLIFQGGSESLDSDDALRVRSSSSNKQESLDINNRDQCGISHDNASALQLHNLEEDKSETIHVDASAEEVRGITHADTSSVGSESSGNELSSSSDEEIESMLTSSNVEENMETDPKHAKDAPKSAAVSEEKALELAASAGLKDCDHLDTCRIYHAPRHVAILKAYALYDQEIGYCQGMSDLLSPILAVMEEDDEAFWCFVGFMKKAQHNFRLNEIQL